uniref:ABC transporter domain-containing protein n=1 Tax=Dunaliella tertiolecta TaxID=3047 RepID=A0A7S3QK67_DUNTE|mmetsp:Transcript_28715/g.77394  ORF Transcript_28715/g.77394 Transcript_28715/m.77394 type:complete len:428 (-) Transcript_28715:72-1355(-)
MAPANEGNVSIEIKNPAFPEQGGTDVEMGGVGQAPQSTGPAPEQQGNNASQLLNEVPREKQVTVTLNNVCAYVPVLVTPDSKSSNDGPKERKVLFDCCGVVEPGEVLALMGPSGSGKSTLLQVLGGRSTCRITGDMLFNGVPLTKNVKKKLGFVTQDDVLFAELTVYETLFFSAMLRLPRSWPKEKKLERVEMVLTILGLQKCRDTIIGNNMMRGVSGGERKRVSIGAELLINPSVLFLDEPTSGLDSTTALKLVQTCRQLASGGRTVIASIHQPSSRLYQQMDKLMLLSEGYILYYGHTLAAAHWLAACGHPLPFGVSVPDHLLDLANGDIPGIPPEHSLAAKQELLDKFLHRKIGTGKHGIQPEDVGGADTDGLPDPKHVDEKGHAAQAVSSSCSSASSRAVGQGREPSTSDDEGTEQNRPRQWR